MKTSDYQNNVYYQVAYKYAQTKYIGCRTSDQMAEKVKDIETNKNSSVYYGSIVCSEIDGVPWTLEINKAFIAGAIDKGCTIVLLTRLEGFLYTKKNRQEKISTTQYELFWLFMNGYTLQYRNDSIRIVPPRPLLVTDKRYIADNPSLNEVLQCLRAHINGFLKISPRSSLSLFEKKSSSAPTANTTGSALSWTM